MFACPPAVCEVRAMATHRFHRNPKVYSHPSSVFQVGVRGADIAPRLVLRIPVAHEHTHDIITLSTGDDIDGTRHGKKGDASDIYTGKINFCVSEPGVATPYHKIVFACSFKPEDRFRESSGPELLE